MITEKNKVNNSIYVIEAYKHNGMWVFDDDRVGLVKEPFVAGADTLIDKFAGGKKNIGIVFSVIAFPDHTLVVDLVNPPTDDLSGSDYICESLDHKLWLCPALNLYYPVSPDRIYLKFVESES